MFPTGFIGVCSLGVRKVIFGAFDKKQKFFFANYSQWQTYKEFKKKISK